MSPHERRRVVFFQQMAAAAGRDDTRGARRKRKEPAVSFPQVFMTFTFYLPLAASQPGGLKPCFYVSQDGGSIPNQSVLWSRSGSESHRC